MTINENLQKKFQPKYGVAIFAKIINLRYTTLLVYCGRCFGGLLYVIETVFLGHAHIPHACYLNDCNSPKLGEKVQSENLNFI